MSLYIMWLLHSAVCWSNVEGRMKFIGTKHFTLNRSVQFNSTCTNDSVNSSQYTNLWAAPCTVEYYWWLIISVHPRRLAHAAHYSKYQQDKGSTYLQQLVIKYLYPEHSQDNRSPWASKARLQGYAIEYSTGIWTDKLFTFWVLV